jgi:hypothetical protein
MATKKSNRKRRKGNKTLSQKKRERAGKNLTIDNKMKESKIKVLAHEFLPSTLSYLMLPP